MSLSAVALVALVSYEGFTDRAVIPVPGDVPTIGFGTTAGVKIGDKITPAKALERVMHDVARFEGAVARCVKVPLHQHEFDAALSLAYNIGDGAFCGSTVVRRFNARDYSGACDAFLVWVKHKGKELRGLVVRRQKERLQCLGLA